MAYTTIDDPSAFFQVKTYAGTGNAQGITLDGNSDFQPDWVWLKNRTINANHALFDSVRGATIVLNSNANTADATEAQMLKSFDSDGFTVGTDSTVNDNDSGTINIVSWNWKAGTAFSNDASSTSVGSIDSVGSVSTDAGFSIVSWTGTGTAGTIAHGLGKLPKMIIAKQRNSTANWSVYFLDTSIAYNNVRNYLELDTNIASTGDSGARWGAYGNYSTTTFGVGTNADTNADGSTYIAYAFSDIQGYSKIGKWVGNGNADGAFVYTGFRPAFVMYKNTSQTDDWFISDNKRLGYNPNNNYLRPSLNNGDNATQRINLFSNGFKLTTSDKGANESGDVYIYMAFAEAPFVTSTGIPTTAR